MMPSLYFFGIFFCLASEHRSLADLPGGTDIVRCH